MEVNRGEERLEGVNDAMRFLENSWREVQASLREEVRKRREVEKRLEVSQSENWSLRQELACLRMAQMEVDRQMGQMEGTHGPDAAVAEPPSAG
jgi:hypothetical protein